MAESTMKTTIVPVKAMDLGTITTRTQDDLLDVLDITLSDSVDAKHLKNAAEQLRTSNVPIAFPTETVYGLGADATRSEAVKGIYKAKQRPSDNPLIVHFASLDQIRRVLAPSSTEDPIPSIYHSLIKQFWPGPLTILLPNPKGSVLAPEVTAGLTTFGARIPKHIIALSLIQLADVPVAAPSANASTKPSPTAAEHVAYDLDGRIETIIDGGPCEVGVESTVVDGLTQPPLILRPGGISLEQIRKCSGWEQTGIGYKNTAETNSQPRAPGMKYRHYSPKARVILFSAGITPTSQDFIDTKTRSVGVVSTVSWVINTSGIGNSSTKPDSNLAQHTDRLEAVSSMDPTSTRYDGGLATVLSTDSTSTQHTSTLEAVLSTDPTATQHTGGFKAMLDSTAITVDALKTYHHIVNIEQDFNIHEIRLGPHTENIARGIFGALRELDKQDVSTIFVEGIDDSQDDLAAAVMNRLKKASEITV